MSTTDSVKVLFIVGKGRSGTTLLNSVLGQIHGIFPAGELVNIWEWGFVKDRRCGCGRKILECPMWSKVLEILSAEQELSPEAFLRSQGEVLRWSKLPKVLRQRPGEESDWKALEEFLALNARLYRAIVQVTGARCIVESTKLPAAPTVLGLVPGTDSYVVHLVRDPRAVVYSWNREKLWERDGTETMPRYGPVYTTASWWGRNLLAELVARRLGARRSILVRYEDFVARPRSVLEDILGLIGERDGLSFLQDGSVTLSPTHAVAGNVSRFDVGTLKLELDDAWAARQPRRHRLVATALAVPFLQRYGYPLRPERPPSAG